jgi:hypothetical protein
MKAFMPENKQNNNKATLERDGKTEQGCRCAEAFH